MPLNFIHTTLVQAQNQLSQLLNDVAPQFTFYGQPELQGYIAEALRFWGAATGYWRDRANIAVSTATGTIPTADNPWYDLPTFLPTLRGYNVTDTQLVQSIELCLLEPAAIPPAYIGTSQFNLNDILYACNRRRDQFLLETGSGLVHLPVSMPAAGVSRIALPDTTIGIKRAAWKDGVTGAWSPIQRSDEWYMLADQQGSPGALGIPLVYSVAVTPPLSLQIYPPPAAAGQLDLIVSQTGTPLDGTGNLLGIPDDFWWVVKFGVLADLLAQDGPAKDPLRAEYCQRRWTEGIQMAKVAQSVMFVSIDGVPSYVEALDAIDVGRPLWQNYRRTPFAAAMAGINLLAMVDVPNSAYSVEVDTVTNAIVPSNPGDFIQVGREELAVILGYAEHLAVFKCGGAEFEATLKLHEAIMRLAKSYNDKLAFNTQPALGDRVQQERARRPVVASGMVQ